MPQNHKPEIPWLLITIGALGAAGALIAFSQLPQRLTGELETSATPHRPAPPIELKDSAGKPHTLEELRGNVVLVHFWASWCPPCRQEMPRLLELAERYKDRKFKILAVSVDKSWADALRTLPASSVPSDMLSLVDLSDSVADQYGTHEFPETYLLNPRLEIVAKLVGIQPWGSATVRQAVERMLKN